MSESEPTTYGEPDTTIETREDTDVPSGSNTVGEPEQVPEPIVESGINSHLYAVKTTGGQEKVVMRLLEAKMKLNKIDVQSVLMIDDIKGYIVIEAADPQKMFNTIQGMRHVKGQLRGEMEFKEIEGYLVKKSLVSELEVNNTVEIIGGPFKGMKATITRIDAEKEEAVVVLLDASYQLPVTVDANYLKKALE